MIRSPITQSERIEPICHYKTSITSDSHIIDRPVDNYLCLDSGVVFNATGSRGDEKGFYVDDYDLHSESVISEFKYFDAGASVGIYDSILDFIIQHTELADEGRYLDVGCGKGMLLRKFAQRHPSWRLSGVEPSQHAAKFFSQTLPNLTIFEGMLEDSPFVSQSFNLISANGVLEHVPSPVAFLQQLRSMLTEHGRLYIGVPNFANNPADLFTYDHLFRFTPESINTCFQLAGLRVVGAHVDARRVPMWYVLEKAEPQSLTALEVNIEQARALVASKLEEIAAVFASYDDSMAACQADEHIAIYGTGAFALLGPYYSHLAPEKIGVFLDDNDSMWGAERMGIAVTAPQKLVEHPSIKHVIFSANPCYFALLRQKITTTLQGLQRVCQVHVPMLDEV